MNKRREPVSQPHKEAEPVTEHNPKLDEHPGSNTIKNPNEWTSGDDPMTGAQASYLKTLSEEATDEAEGYEDGLSKAEASKRIDALKHKLGR